MIKSNEVIIIINNLNLNNQFFFAGFLDGKHFRLVYPNITR